MKIELLNVMIEIQKNSTVTDRYANHKSEWIPYYTCHATASAESPKENSEAGLIVDDSKIDLQNAMKKPVNKSQRLKANGRNAKEKRMQSAA